jgi:hypothetical protein
MAHKQMASAGINRGLNILSPEKTKNTNISVTKVSQIQFSLAGQQNQCLKKSSEATDPIAT